MNHMHMETPALVLKDLTDPGRATREVFSGAEEGLSVPFSQEAIIRGYKSALLARLYW